MKAVPVGAAFLLSEALQKNLPKNLFIYELFVDLR